MAFFVGPYLVQRGDTWYFRRRIPANSIERLGRREFLLSLHTDSQREARRRSMACMDVTDRLLASATATKLEALNSLEILRASLRGAQLQIMPADHAEALPRPVNANTPTPTLVHPVAETLVLTAWNEYELENQSRWRPQTLVQYRQMIDEFTHPAMCGNKPIGEIRREDLIAYREKLARLPAQRGKLAAYRDKSIAELLAEDIPHSKRLSDRTINERLTLLSSFFRWCKEIKRYLSDDVSYRVQITKAEGEERAAFTSEDLGLIFGSPGYSSDPFAYRWQHWIPLLGYYTGARIAEIAQLHCDDLVSIDGILCLRLKDDGEDQRLKTKNASRLVPLHPELHRLGFSAYVASIKGKNERVFPEIRKMRNSWGTEPSKWFTKYRRSVGIPDTDEAGRQKVFHSFRKTFVTRLRQAGVDVSLVQQLVGHARTAHGVTEIYTEGFGVRACWEAVCKLPTAISNS